MVAPSASRSARRGAGPDHNPLRGHGDAGENAARGVGDRRVRGAGTAGREHADGKHQHQRENSVWMMVEKLSDTAVPLQLKTSDEGLVEQIREPDSLWYRDARNPRLVNYPG